MKKEEDRTYEGLEITRLRSKLAYLEAEMDRVKRRTPYPKLCSLPHLCANQGTCQKEWVCND